MALWVSESKFWDHFSIQTSPQNPQKYTLGTQIGPQKVIFGDFAFFEYFYLIFFEHSMSMGRIFQMARILISLSQNAKLLHFFFKQKTAYEIGVRLVGSEMCIRDRRHF